ncbi:histones H3 and H4 [Candidatus Methanoperedens nitroreducens]|uniref:Histones H3 and H4 n=1 Tax=Candidatus Methanoperedens nitratireducens TaxID=1392998 RepID=A0A062VBD0_9EURY|nr:histone family protein [Candidatus Methanoperedens nitroreducens]KCZ72620.1 histones H3 and H4 [Candidatus Methanoperedens nitroreducens]MDJ1423448.1 histone family protein [Candidatus Methanoperedens sp.]
MTQQIPPILPLAPVERVIRKAGADRVSEGAGIELAKVLEEYGLEVSREAITLAKHAGRTTVKEEDIRLAVARIRRGN